MAASKAMQEAVIKKVEAMCKAAEIDYAILTPEGEILGTLDVRRENDPIRLQINQWEAETQYSEKVLALGVGEIAVFDIDDPTLIPEGSRSKRADSFGASLRSFAIRIFGKDHFIVTREVGHFELMRTE